MSECEAETTYKKIEAKRRAEICDEKLPIFYQQKSLNNNDKAKFMIGEDTNQGVCILYD